MVGVRWELSLLQGGGRPGGGRLPGGGGRLASQEAGVGHGGGGAHVGEDRLGGGRRVERGRQERLRFWVGGDVRSWRVGGAGGRGGPCEPGVVVGLLHPQPANVQPRHLHNHLLQKAFLVIELNKKILLIE